MLGAGASERLITAISGLIRLMVHPRARIVRLLTQTTLLEQRRFYAEEWNTPRWRGLFRLILNRAVLRRTYDPAFFQYVVKPSFVDHFLRTCEHGLTQLPVAGNYFLHHMFTGAYRTDLGGGLPPYLDQPVPVPNVRLVDGGFESFLAVQPAHSVAGFSLSNICEWLTPSQVERLFGEIVQTAVPGARRCFRNFLGWTEVPDR